MERDWESRTVYQALEVTPEQIEASRGDQAFVDVTDDAAAVAELRRVRGLPLIDTDAEMRAAYPNVALTALAIPIERGGIDGIKMRQDGSVVAADDVVVGTIERLCHRPRIIVSGGQSGADRAGWDAAIAVGIDHDGFVPKGRICEDGVIPWRYECRQTGTSNYGERTALNVKHSDATLLFHFGVCSGGSLLTFKLARKFAKPCMVVKLDRFSDEHVAGIRAWVDKYKPEILNVAGQRESKAPGISEIVKNILVAVFEGGA